MDEISAKPDDNRPGFERHGVVLGQLVNHPAVKVSVGIQIVRDFRLVHEADRRTRLTGGQKIARAETKFGVVGKHLKMDLKR